MLYEKFELDKKKKELSKAENRRSGNTMVKDIKQKNRGHQKHYTEN